jgi:hypothetical protein
MGCGAELQNRTPKHVEWDRGFNAATGQAFRCIGHAVICFDRVSAHPWFMTKDDRDQDAQD